MDQCARSACARSEGARSEGRSVCENGDSDKVGCHRLLSASESKRCLKPMFGERCLVSLTGDQLWPSW